MANYRSEDERNELKSNVLHAAIKLFLTNGYSQTTTREIAAVAGVNVSTMNRVFGSKENILCELVTYVLERQFAETGRFLTDVPHDKILFYAAETTLQLSLTESDEHIRDLYAAAYSMSRSAAIIQHTITGKLEDIFREHLPDLETKDFYELEIASSGVMRNFMSVPCDLYFTMERKIARFIETTFLIYRVSDEKIQEAIEFVSQFDYPAIVKGVMESMMRELGERAR